MNPGYEATKPSKKQIVFPIVVLIVTVVIAGGLLFAAKQAGRNEEAETIFIAPGAQSIEVTRPGEYEVDMAVETTYEGKSYSLPENFTGIEGTLSYDNQDVELTKINSVSAYGKDGEKGKACFTFEADEAGTYILTTTITDKSIDEVVLVARRSDTQVGKIMLLSTAAVMIGLMGILQFIAYMIYNLIRWGIYIYQTKH